MNIWNFIHLNCGEWYEDMIDHQGYAQNLSSSEIKAWKKFWPEQDSNSWRLWYCLQWSTNWVTKPTGSWPLSAAAYKKPIFYCKRRQSLIHTARHYSLFLLTFILLTHVTHPPSHQKRCHITPLPLIMATYPQHALAPVPKVAIVKRFGCIY